ncbi:hypothetical protein CHARACLAT_017845 [Characodon lateralis]|uniref:Uncharacterized protein n=1 Tax=Characodon lateralis TaxID=208331 RepID=A0ABU7E1D6_9TELE|nr:hypothetical protein [Characodon lateralis]
MFMTSFLCPNQRFKPLPPILSPDSASLALTQFLSPDHCILPSHWGCKPENLYDVFLLSAVHHIEEPKFSFLILPQILKRLVALFLSLVFSILCSATNLSVVPQRFLSLLLVVSCQISPRAFNKSFESYLLCPAEISGPLCYPLHSGWLEQITLPHGQFGTFKDFTAL